MIGQVESLWRYPVKSMRGEQLQHAFLGYGGVYGDRRFAFISSAAPDDFPFLTAREKHEMLLHRATYRHPDKMSQPNRRYHDGYAAIDVETPAGERLALTDPRLNNMLQAGLREPHQLTLIQSDTAITDSRPVSIFSLQTSQQLAHEVDMPLDKRRFRANIYIDLADGRGFAEDNLVGERLSIGPVVVIEVLKRNQRCKLITLDPDTATPSPQVMRTVARDHESRAGIYAAVLVEGIVTTGDSIQLLS